MKTAISLPDQVFYEAEETAQHMGIPRSKLYLNALLEYWEKNYSIKSMKFLWRKK
jgi:hypothetical protein